MTTLDEARWLADEEARQLIMTKPTQAQIEALLREAQPYVCQFIHEAKNYGRAQILNDKINSALTAAAEVGPKIMPLAQADVDDAEFDRIATIERCAQVAEQYGQPNNSDWPIRIAAAIRKLKDKPPLDPNIVYPGKDPDFVFPEED